MQLTKTDFMQYLNCPKSLWLLKNRPVDYPHWEFSAYARKIVAEGYEVERWVREHLNAQADADTYSYQREFQTDRGLYAKVDVVHDNGDGTINLYEVKSSTGVKTDRKHNQLKDAAFQRLVAEETGARVSKVFLVHLNRDYVRQGVIDPAKLLTTVDVTDRVAEIEADTRREIENALALLGEAAIDEQSCSCINITRSNHCDAFDYFNPGIPQPSIYSLPRINERRIRNFVDQNRFALDDIRGDEVSPNQALVLRSAHEARPFIDRHVIEEFLGKVEYPIHFIDYETV